jgi:hypothetical protein
VLRATFVAVAVIALPVPAGGADATFVDCLFARMRPEVAAGHVPLPDQLDEPASLIVARALQRCEREGHVPEQGMRWEIMDWSIEWIFDVRQRANDYAVKICGDRCSNEVLGEAYSEELRRLAYRDGRIP